MGEPSTIGLASGLEDPFPVLIRELLQHVRREVGGHDKEFNVFAVLDLAVAPYEGDDVIEHLLAAVPVIGEVLLEVLADSLAEPVIGQSVALRACGLDDEGTPSEEGVL